MVAVSMLSGFACTAAHITMLASKVARIIPESTTDGLFMASLYK
jgi:hypothetical protein